MQISRNVKVALTDGQTDNGQTTDGPPENIMPWPPIVGGGGIKLVSVV